LLTEVIDQFPESLPPVDDDCAGEWFEEDVGDGREFCCEGACCCCCGSRGDGEMDVGVAPFVML